MRSKWKGAVILPTLFNALRNKKAQLERKQEKSIKIFNKAIPLLSYNTLKKGTRFSLNVYNGITMTKLLVTPEMHYHKMGEFVLTRKQHIFRSKKKKA